MFLTIVEKLKTIYKCKEISKFDEVKFKICVGNKFVKLVLKVISDIINLGIDFESFRVVINAEGLGP